MTYRFNQWPGTLAKLVIGSSFITMKITFDHLFSGHWCCHCHHWETFPLSPCIPFLWTPIIDVPKATLPPFSSSMLPWIWPIFSTHAFLFTCCFRATGVAPLCVRRRCVAGGADISDLTNGEKDGVPSGEGEQCSAKYRCNQCGEPIDEVCHHT